MSNHKQTRLPALGMFQPAAINEQSAKLNQRELLCQINEPLFISDQDNSVVLQAGTTAPAESDLLLFTGMVAPCRLENLGDPDFCHDHGIRYPYIGGSMAKGISSVAIAKALGKEGMLGFFGSAGLLPEETEAAIDQLEADDKNIPYGLNLIHSPNEPQLENNLVDLYLRRKVKLVEASAFLALTLPIVRYRTHGIHRDQTGQIVTPNRVIAKVSREEVATRFFSPPPEKYLQQLVASGDLSEEQAELALHIPMAQDVTVEADSGGHTDNRPAIALFPTIAALRDRLQQQFDYKQKLRVGLGGGISTPASAAAAFALGAAYLVTGSVNQACIESGTCDAVRQMLAETRQADITMAPSGDMFEMGVKVQVLKRGTMFSMRATKLYELYRAHSSIEDLPADEREKLEKTLFRKNLDQVWEETSSFFKQRDPQQLAKAEADPKYKLALVFRWYLGQSPVWANRGVEDRKLDYQVWCGPAMGAFNEWVKGSFMEATEQRRVATVAWNILFGAAVLMRANQLKLQGVPIDDAAELSTPLKIEQIKEFLS